MAYIFCSQYAFALLKTSVLAGVFKGLLTKNYMPSMDSVPKFLFIISLSFLKEKFTFSGCKPSKQQFSTSLQNFHQAHSQHSAGDQFPYPYRQHEISEASGYAIYVV